MSYTVQKESLRDNTYFSLKKEVIFFSLTAFFLLASSILVSFSDKFIPLLYDFFSQKVFHREFKIEKWLTTLQSFLIIPVLLIIFVNALFFHKHNDKFKSLYLLLVFACIMFSLFFTVYSSLSNSIDADLASETLLARECLKEKSLVPFGWCYSTEIRLLNTQLISTPLFAFIKSWDLVRALTSLISSLILAFAAFKLLSALRIEKTYLKVLGAALVTCPWSNLHFYVIGYGSYYIPHLALGFLFLYYFVKLISGTAKNKKKALRIFYLLAFVSGLSTIRYILIYVFPLFLALVILYWPEEKFYKPLSFSKIKELILERPFICKAFIALILSGLGYVFNNVVLHSLFSFSQWNDVAFNFFGEVTVGKLLSTILTAFGYQENVAVFTPGGVINVLVYCALAVFISAMIKSFKTTLTIEKKLLLIFTLSTVAFNSFLYFTTDEFISRYYITVLPYAIISLVIFLDNLSLTLPLRYAAGILFSVCIFTSSYVSMQNNLTHDNNKDLKKAMAFLNEKVLQDSDYAFGYSVFDYANVITYFTEEKIEVATVKKIRKDGKDVLPSDFTPATWLTPKRYNSHIHKGKTFFFISKELFENSSLSIFENAEKVYDDGIYLIYEYKSQEDFKASFSEN